MYWIVSIIILLFSLLHSHFPVNAAEQCTYGSTQARVQKDISDPWKQSVTVGCSRSFNVGSFHDGTGQFAHDTKLKVTGPNGFNKTYNNGNTVHVPTDGNYKLKVTTPGQSGSACTEQATVHVSCSKPQQCTYTSTQARVQKNSSDPWKQQISIGCERQFNVGSFHNGTGQFANDTKLLITGPNGFKQTYKNGDIVTVTNNGSYILNVTTNKQHGSSCEQKAKVIVQCNKPPTPTITPTPPSHCSYNSTQARIQRSIHQDWVDHLTIKCGDTFNVGSFHNGIDQFATDTNLLVTGPYGFNYTPHSPYSPLSF